MSLITDEIKADLANYRISKSVPAGSWIVKADGYHIQMWSEKYFWKHKGHAKMAICNHFKELFLNYKHSDDLEGMNIWYEGDLVEHLLSEKIITIEQIP